MTANLTVDGPTVAALLGRARFRYRDEIELHDGIAACLTEAGIPVDATDREIRLSARDRIDFLLPGGLGIEAKVAGRPGDVWRQITRYAQHPRVRSLLLVTTRARHAVDAPTTINGKTITVCVLRGGLK